MSSHLPLGGINPGAIINPPNQSNSNRSDLFTQKSETAKIIDTSGMQTNGAHILDMQQLRQAEQEGKPISPGEKHLIKSIQNAMKAAEGPDVTFQYSIHQETHRVILKIINKNTGKVIREIPPKSQLDLLAKLWQKMGIVIDTHK